MAYSTAQHSHSPAPPRNNDAFDMAPGVASPGDSSAKLRGVLALAVRTHSFVCASDKLDSLASSR